MSILSSFRGSTCYCAVPVTFASGKRSIEQSVDSHVVSYGNSLTNRQELLDRLSVTTSFARRFFEVFTPLAFGCSSCWKSTCLTTRFAQKESNLLEIQLESLSAILSANRAISLLEPSSYFHSIRCYCALLTY